MESNAYLSMIREDINSNGKNAASGKPSCGLKKCCRKQPRKINVSLLIAPFTDSQEMRLEYPLSKKGHNLITMNNTHLVVFFFSAAFAMQEYLWDPSLNIQWCILTPETAPHCQHYQYSCFHWDFSYVSGCFLQYPSCLHSRSVSACSPWVSSPRNTGHYHSSQPRWSHCHRKSSA